MGGAVPGGQFRLAAVMGTAWKADLRKKKIDAFRRSQVAVDSLMNGATAPMTGGAVGSRGWRTATKGFQIVRFEGREVYRTSGVQEE